MDKQNNLRKIPPEFWLVAIATAFFTYAELAYEVALTRIFSVMLTYHYVFAVISFSLFGLGLGAMLFKWWRKWFSKSDYRVNFSLFTISILVSVILIVKLPIYDNPGLVDFRLWIYIFLATLPFFFAGLILAEVFQKFAQFSSILYGFDLFGGALGAITVVFLLNNFSAVNASLIVASIAAFGALIVGFSAKKMPVLNVIPIILLGVVLSITLFSKINLEVPVAMDPNKDMYRMLNDPIGRAKIIESRWSAFGRTDVVYSPRYPDEMVLFVDGAAGSSMYKLDDFLPDSSKGYNLITRSFGEYFPFFFLNDSEKNSALIIGPGGGRDVVVALMGGVQDITAVEVNPDVVQIVKDYKDFNGGIYSGYPNVRVVTKEGRNYLRDEKRKYDLIMTSIPVTKSSRSIEGYALTENYLFTVEAFTDYLNHLTEEGRIVIVSHGKEEIYRLLSLALKAFSRRGIPEKEAMKHIYILGSKMMSMPTMVIKKQPFNEPDALKRHEMLHRLGYDKGSYYIPYVRQVSRRLFIAQLGKSLEWNMFDPIFVSIAAGESTMEQFVKAVPYNLKPVYDDDPFFYRYQQGLPKPFGTFLFLIVAFFVILTAILLLPKRSLTGRNSFIKMFSVYPQMKLFLLIFTFIGFAFMMLEISIFQKIMLYLGHPVFALTVLLFSLLLGTAIGSFLSSFVRKKLETTAIISMILVSILIILYSAYFSRIFALNLNAKLIAMLFLVPLGFFLGIPFPISIRLMKRRGFGEMIPYMWGINGITSVLGSALAMMIGIQLGFSYAIYLAALFYLSVGLFFWLMKKAKPVVGMESTVKNV